MGNVIDWPKFNIRKQQEESKPTRVVCCMNCHQAFFNLIIDDKDENDIIIECAMCGQELPEGGDEGWS